jgi:uncharacterized protein (DUF849 family)
MSRVWIKACLNGARSRQDHPAVPFTPEELASQAADAVEAGARAVHIHPRDAQFRESLEASVIGAATLAVRELVPDVPIGVSTGLWITDRDPVARLGAVQRWAELPAAQRPDFASVNFSEPGHDELMVLLLGMGIEVEAGTVSEVDVDALAASGLADRCLRVLVEPIRNPPENSAKVATDILRRLDQHRVMAPRLMRGTGTATWPMLALAHDLGLAGRIGFEDAQAGPNGEPVRHNADLVRLAFSYLDAR